MADESSRRGAGFAVAEESGLDPEPFFQAVEGGTLDLPCPRIKGKAAKEHGDKDLSATHLLSLPEQD